MRLVELSGAAPLELMPGVVLSLDSNGMALSFDTPLIALSSAVLNGGFQQADGFVNLRVDSKTPPTTEDPSCTIAERAKDTIPQGTVVGMMTAASMKSLRIAAEEVEEETLLVAITSGLENARRAGDLAELRSLDASPDKAGTINVAVVTSACMAEEALVELLTVVTEAKAAVLQELDVRSPVSGEIATGTGTDSTAVFSLPGGQKVRFAGKHTLLGERVAQLTMHALRCSLMRQPGSLN